MFHEDPFLAAAIAASVALAAPVIGAPPVSFTPPEARALSIAEREGPEALRHFVERTRMVYALPMSEFRAAPADAQRVMDEFRERLLRDLQHD